MVPFIRTPYNYDRDLASEETGLRCEDSSLAQQHQKEEADINTIVRRFGLTGELPSNVRMPVYGDFTEVGTYQECLNAVKAADLAFAQMPADVRARFHNNAEEFVAFCLDENNREEAEKLGLVNPKPVEKPVEPATTPA